VPEIGKISPPPALARVIAYVDGFNLYFGLRAGKLKRFYWLDIHSLCANLLVADQQLVSAKYFTSRISGPLEGDSSPVATALADVRIIEGQFLDKGGRCFTCGATWPRFEEKMTDVNIATELLTDAFTNSFDTALLISADSDLVPPIRAVRRHFPKMRIVVAFPPNRASKELRKAAHAHLTIGHGTLGKSQLSEEIPKSDGFILRRPTAWR
jgi:uncharacterized LabA/DUF88 family protein